MAANKNSRWNYHEVNTEVLLSNKDDSRVLKRQDDILCLKNNLHHLKQE